MIGEKKAREIAQKLIDESKHNVVITYFSQIGSEKEEDGLYIFGVKDIKSGKTFYPGQLFPAIRKGDGELIDFALIPPGM